MTSPTPPSEAPPIADPGPPPPAPAGMPTASDRFFAWVRGFGVVRIDGWLGGVCAGIAARLRIDPVIVRGIVVVATVLGAPMFLLYAIAWALLPDVRGRIHLQELFRGRWDSALTGIVILALLTLVPVLPWLSSLLLWPLWGFATGGGYPADGWGWNLLPSGLTIFIGWTVTLAAIGGLVFLVVRLARRGRSPREDSDPRTASADLAAPGSVGAPSSGDGAPTTPLDSESEVPDAAPAPPIEPPAPTGPTTDAEVAAWRAQHDEWRTQNDAWRRAQQDAGRAAREQARREREAAGAVFAAEAAERRRIRKLTAPRTSAPFVFFVLGAALVVGAATALWGSSGDEAFAPPLGVFAAAAVVGVSMIVAGALRRRSGFLAFVTIVLLVLGGLSTATAAMRGVVLGDVGITNLTPHDEPVIQPWGSLDIALFERGAVSDPIVVEKQSGYTSISVDPGVELSLSVRSGSGLVQFISIDPDTGDYVEQPVDQRRTARDDGWLVETTIVSGDGPPTRRQRVEIDQRSGGVTVYFTLPRDTETMP